jgi:DNA modification methylase
MVKSTEVRKNPRKPISEENKPGRYDERNRLNDLTGKDWLLLTKSYWFSEPNGEDKDAYEHPAPFLVKDVLKLISLFTKKGMTVLDPFVGSGTTIIAANKIGRKCIGMDINEDYKELAESRILKYGFSDYTYIVGDAYSEVDKVSMIDYIVTSPPYYNILRNNSNGTRKYNGKSYRMGAREGVQYYSEHPNDLGNLEDYSKYIALLGTIMSKCFTKLREGKYCTLVMSDFTVNKKEVCVQGDIARMMVDIGFEFCGTTVLLQKVKPLYPFAYPYAYRINHHHHNLITFQKTEKPTI